MSWRHNADSTTTIPPAPGAPVTPPGAPEPAPMATWRKALVAVLFLALIAGIVALVATRSSNNDAAEQGTGTTGSLPVQQTTPATTSAQSDQPPPLLNTGEDWNAIVRSMIAYDDWLHLHPRPELLDQIMVSTNKDYADTKLGLTNLATKGWRYDPVPSAVVVQHAEVTTRMSPTRVGVVIRLGPAPQYRVVDQSGKVIQDTPAKSDGNTVEWTLVQSPGDPHWRLADVIPL